MYGRRQTLFDPIDTLLAFCNAQVPTSSTHQLVLSSPYCRCKSEIAVLGFYGLAPQLLKPCFKDSSSAGPGVLVKPRFRLQVSSSGNEAKEPADGSLYNRFFSLSILSSVESNVCWPDTASFAMFDIQAECLA